MECSELGQRSIAAVSGNRMCIEGHIAGESLSFFTLTELPAITRQSIENGRLNLRWNDPAKGMKLQRATSLTNPNWQDLLGSETTNAVSLPIWGGTEFFRLMEP